MPHCKNCNNMWSGGQELVCPGCGSAIFRTDLSLEEYIKYHIYKEIEEDVILYGSDANRIERPDGDVCPACKNIVQEDGHERYFCCNNLWR